MKLLQALTLLIAAVLLSTACASTQTPGTGAQTSARAIEQSDSQSRTSCVGSYTAYNCGGAQQ
jgi:hypothetical protein